MQSIARQAVTAGQGNVTAVTESVVAQLRQHYPRRVCHCARTRCRPGLGGEQHSTVRHGLGRRTSGLWQLCAAHRGARTAEAAQLPQLPAHAQHAVWQQHLQSQQASCAGVSWVTHTARVLCFGFGCGPGTLWPSRRGCSTTRGAQWAQCWCCTAASQARGTADGGTQSAFHQLTRVHVAPVRRVHHHLWDGGGDGGPHGAVPVRRASPLVTWLAAWMCI
jgi:hypothetical protein